MTKIAIYGDSFAGSFDGWPKHFQELYKGSKVTIMADGGTSANFSYMRFLETHKKYDIVIFLWTSITRNALIVKNFKSKKYNIHGFTESQFYDTKLSDLIKEYLIQNKTIKSYTSNFVDIDKKWIVYESFFSKKYPSKNILENIAMRDSVTLRRPDSINVECFSSPLGLSKFGMMNIPLSDWCQFSSGSESYDENELRVNHLSFKQNVEFAKYLYRHVTTDNFNIHDTFSNPRKYYTMSKNFEESGFIIHNERI